MKYCLSARQPNKILQQADEISLTYKDIDYILELIERESKKTVIIHIPKEIDDFDWESVQAYSNKINILVALSDLRKHMPLARQYGISYYWEYPATTFFELQSLLENEVDAILIGGPLCFQLDKVQNIIQHSIPVRMVPNLAYDAYIPRKDGICGTYVRPEDVDYYENYVDVFEFIADSLQQEGTLFRVYSKDKKWEGNLNFLITNLNVNVDNRGIVDDFGERRLTCGQTCMSHNTCHFCERAISLCRAIDKAAPELLKDIN